MTNKAITLGAAFLTTCAVTALALRMMRKVEPVLKKSVTEHDFLEVMKLIARSIFSRLFEAAQVAQRAPTRDTEHNANALVASVHQELERTQCIILRQLGLSVHDLQEAQGRYYGKGNKDLDTTVDCINEMFIQYSAQQFPVLPESVQYSMATSHLTDDQILKVIREALMSKTTELGGAGSYASALAVEEQCIGAAAGFDSSLQLYNEAAKRLNSAKSGNEFKLRLMQTVIECQNIVKSRLVE